jgi:hypothetical protein
MHTGEDDVRVFEREADAVGVELRVPRAMKNFLHAEGAKDRLLPLAKDEAQSAIGRGDDLDKVLGGSGMLEGHAHGVGIGE